MTASVLRRDGQLLLDGVVDFDNAASICKAGLDALAECGAEVVVNLSGLRSESSVGVAVIVQWARAAAKAGKSFRLTEVPRQMAAIIQVSGLKPVLPT